MRAEFAVAAPLRAAFVVGILYLLHFLSVSVSHEAESWSDGRADDDDGGDDNDDTCSHSSEEGRRYER